MTFAPDRHPARLKPLPRRVPDPGLMMVTVVALIGIGVTMVFSASSKLVAAGADSSFWDSPGAKQMIFVPPALVLMWLASHAPYRFWRLRRRVPLSPSLWLALAAVGLVAATLIAPESLAPTINGARRWFRFGPLSFQPSELAKLALVIALASVMGDRRFRPQLFDRARRRTMTFWRFLMGLIPLLLLGGLGWALVRIGAGFVGLPRYDQVGLGAACLVAILWLLLWIRSWLAMKLAVRRIHAGVVPLLGLILLTVLPVIKEDFGTGALIGLVGGCLLLGGGMSVLLAILAAAPAGALAALFILAEPYRIARVKTWWSGHADIRGAGYHIYQSGLTIASGGWFGLGLGNGIQKFEYLPEGTTDFIFPIICEELGLVGGFIVIGLLLLLLWQLIRTMRSASDALGQLIVLGVTLVIGLQAAMNIAVVTGAVPAKGIALPFVSAGGSGLLIMAIALGLAANVARTAGRDQEGID